MRVIVRECVAGYVVELENGATLKIRHYSDSSVGKVGLKAAAERFASELRAVLSEPFCCPHCGKRIDSVGG
jgi:hypothetical protein